MLGERVGRSQFMSNYFFKAISAHSDHLLTRITLQSTPFEPIQIGHSKRIRSNLDSGRGRSQAVHSSIELHASH